MNYLIKTILFVFSMSVSLAHAKTGVGTSGGGDTDPMEMATINDLLANQGYKLKNREIQFIRGLDLSSMKSNPIAQQVFKNLLNQGDLEKDILTSKYIPAGPCLDGVDKMHSASTMIGEMGADVCFDVNKLFNDRTNVLALISLALHEHSHHYGKSEDEALEFGKFLLSDLTDKFLQMGLDHANSNCPLLTDLRIGSKISVKRNLDMDLEPVFQRGRVLDGTGSLEPGVYCLVYGQTLTAGTYKIIFEPKSNNGLVRFAADGSGHLVQVGSESSSTDTDLVLNGMQMSCRRIPDVGAKISTCEFNDAVYGTMSIVP